MNFKTHYGIFLSLLGGLIFPQSAVFKPAIPFLLAVLLFLNFLNLDFRFGHFLSPRLLYYPLLVWIVVPPLVYGASVFLSPSLRLGLLLIAVTPAAQASPLMAQLIHARREMVVAGVLLFNLSAPLVYVLLLGLYFTGKGFSIASGGILVRVFLMVGLPLLVALAVKRFVFFSQRFTLLAAKFNPWLLFLLIWIRVSSVAVYLRTLPWLLVIQVFLSVLVLAGLLFGLGFLTGKSEDEKKALALLMGHKNSGLALWLSLSYFSREAAVPVILYLATHHILNALLISRFGGKPPS